MIEKASSNSALLSAWLGVVLVWSTTPLTIQWSSQGAGPIFSLGARFAMGAFFFIVILSLKGWRELFTRSGLFAAGLIGFNMFATMMLVYWAAQYVPSGLIAVIFGLSPIATALWSLLILHNERLTPIGVVGVLLGVAGLWFIFGGGDAFAAAAIPGIAAVIAAMSLQCGVVVLVKRLSMGVGSLTVTGGGVIFSGLLMLPVWFLAGAPFPAEPDPKAIGAIIYLGSMGSVAGFLLYFWLLRRISPIRLSLVTLITPITGLLLGQWLNAEVLPRMVWWGVLLVLLGLSLYQFGDWRRATRITRLYRSEP